jgi:DNA topoisomerase I
VNAYVRATTGQDFTAKDFRTWAGTVLAASALGRLTIEGSVAARKRQVAAVVASVATRLGNTPAVCRRCYIHPGIIDAFMDGKAVDGSARRLRESRMTADEASVLAFLRRVSRSSSSGTSGSTASGRA